ncbi:MAG TPA: polyphosphate kinase 1 [Terriglobia bacterium]|nr:polyphosphate kinase 1 [Terriglobia bacterium]
MEQPDVIERSAPESEPGQTPLFNRELSWIEFNSRVLEEGLDRSLRLLERLKFLSIFSTNLDEFFMVRVAGLQEQLDTNPTSLSPDGLTPATQLKLISERLRPLLKLQTDCLLHEILPGLEALGVRLVEYADVTEDQRQELEKFFAERVFPVLTPLAVDPGHPFPYISNISLNLGILLGPAAGSSDSEPRFARVKIPPKVPRLVPVGDTSFVLLEQLVSAHIESLFPKCAILECQPFRITRDADIEIEEDEAEDLLKSVEQTLRQRRFGFGVRLEVSSAMSEPMVDILRQSVQMEDQDVYSIDGPLNISDLMALYKLNLPMAKDKPFEPVTPPPVFREGETIFDVIRHQDVLLHHPYESFMPVVEFFRAAAKDPNVLAIKATLYRVGSDSPIVKALIEAAERGKQVAVLVELKARFDEENNILWARRLEEAGAHVIYGIVGLKTHAKLTLVVREERSGLRRYVHLGTGNYNPLTAKIYTDLCLFTSNPDFGADSSELFNYLTGYSGQTDYRKLIAAPVRLRERLTTLIRREAEHKAAGRPAGILAKFNGLTDTALIEELYAASAAGVPITLIVRGVCCLRPGVPELSENIQVASIVGRFLEHSRVYKFSNGGDEEMYLGSADLMHRNLNRRVEVLFPIEDPQLRNRVRQETLENCLADNTKIRWLQADGTYRRVSANGDSPHNSQEELMSKYQASAVS